MSERELILGRVREALQLKAPPPGHAHSQSPRSSTAVGSASAREWLPAVGVTFEQQLEMFSRNCVDLKAEFRLFKSEGELSEALGQMEVSEGWQRVATHKGHLTDIACVRLKSPLLCVDAGFEARELEKCDAGITECDALIAQTGSVLLTSRSAGGRGLSVLPPHHIVVARTTQLLPDLPSGFALLKERYAANYPSFVSFISGPSRTGDIERILVLGAHGPKKLTILCLDEKSSKG